MASDEPEQLSLFDAAMARLGAPVAEELQQLARETLQAKDTNPKDAVGTKKAPLSVISGPFLASLGNAMLEGARKYGRHNYRVAGVRYSVYYDAAFRHLMAWWEGEDFDPDSGEHHLVKAAACMAVMFDSVNQGNAVDDRPPRAPAGWLGVANARAAAIVERYPDAKPPCLATDPISSP